MSTIAWIPIFILAAVGLLVVSRILLNVWRARGTRLLTCPENHHCVAVALDRKQAMANAFRIQPAWRLRDCSRWPEKADCPQGCVSQFESRNDTRIQAILASWYLGKSCVTCGKTFTQIHWHDHRPGLLDEVGQQHDWNEFAPETIPQVLGRSQPLCWDCLLVLDFRQHFADLVTDRDFVHADSPAIWKD